MVFVNRMRLLGRQYCLRGLGIVLGVGSCSLAASTAHSRFESPPQLGSVGANLHTEPRREGYKYVICGGGTAAQAAVEVLVEGDPQASMLIVTPWWPGADPGDSNAEVVSGTSVRALDAARKNVTLSSGRRIAYDRALLAVGAEAPTPPTGTVLAPGARGFVGGVRSAIDRAHVLQALDSAQPPLRPHFTLVGGSWLALAAGAELVHGGADVTFLYAEAAFLARHVPKYVSAELRRRLRWASDGGADFLAYAAMRHVVPRGAEAEVYAGVVFDRLALVQFHTDRILLAPTAPPAPTLRAKGLERRAGGFAVNRELSAASDVYAAGACALAPGMEHLAWSDRFAVASGKHAARNMLGERAPFETPRGEVVDVPALRLRLLVTGDVDGALESLGYFACARDADDSTCGGTLRNGAVFYLEPKYAPGVPCTFRVAGALLWDGSPGENLEDENNVMQALHLLLDEPPKERRLLERDLDEFANTYLGISATSRNEDVGRVLWRRHIAARTRPMRQEELLWLDDGVLGVGDFSSPEEKKAQAYSELLRKSAGL